MEVAVAGVGQYSSQFQEQCNLAVEFMPTEGAVPVLKGQEVEVPVAAQCA